MLMAGATLLCLALPCFIIMLVVGLGNRKDHGRFRAILETPTTPVAQLGADRLVALRGRAIAGDEGGVMSPVSGRQVLAYEIDIKEWVPGGRSTGPGSGSHRTLRTMTDCRAFWLDDGSGQRAWIAPHGAPLVMPTRSYAESPGEMIGGLPETVVTWTPPLEAWARGIAGRSQRRLKIATRELENGATLCVLGRARARGGVMCMAGDDPRQPLVLSTVTGTQLESVIGRSAKVSLVAGLLGVVFVLTGAALIVVGILRWVSSVQ